MTTRLMRGNPKVYGEHHFIHVSTAGCDVAPVCKPVEPDKPAEVTRSICRRCGENIHLGENPPNGWVHDGGSTFCLVDALYLRAWGYPRAAEPAEVVPELASLLDDACRAAVADAQAQCDWCDTLRNYTCTYHEGWGDGFEIGMDVVQRIAAQAKEIGR